MAQALSKGQHGLLSWDSGDYAGIRCKAEVVDVLSRAELAALFEAFPGELAPADAYALVACEHPDGPPRLPGMMGLSRQDGAWRLAKSPDGPRFTFEPSS